MIIIDETELRWAWEIVLPPINFQVESISRLRKWCTRSVPGNHCKWRAPKLLKPTPPHPPGGHWAMHTLGGERFQSTNFAISSSRSHFPRNTPRGAFIFYIYNSAYAAARWVFFTLALPLCAAQLLLVLFRPKASAFTFMVHGGLMREHQTKDNCTRWAHIQKVWVGITEFKHWISLWLSRRPMRSAHNFNIYVSHSWKAPKWFWDVEKWATCLSAPISQSRWRTKSGTRCFSIKTAGMWSSRERAYRKCCRWGWVGPNGWDNEPRPRSLPALCHLPSLDIDIMQARYMRRRK